MKHLFQVGLGSGGMVVLDLLAADPRFTTFTLIEPDVYKPHNAVRHYFPASAAGSRKLDLVTAWLKERRPDARIQAFAADLLDPSKQAAYRSAAMDCSVGVCAVDNEPAKYHFNELMRSVGKPWTLGEVLSGGIGGWVHRFVPGGACYGCVATRLQRDIPTDKPPTPDYSDPANVVHEVTIPAAKASIHTIAGLHALWTLELVAEPPANPGCTSMLLTLARVPDLFDMPYRPHRLTIERDPNCLICSPPTSASALRTEDLDVALAEALARLGDG